MRAIVQDRYGTAEDVLRLAEIDRPTNRDDEVLVRVQAASVDRGTWHIMAGLPYPIRLAGFGVRRPKYANPGRSLAGTVEAVGAAVYSAKVLVAIPNTSSPGAKPVTSAPTASTVPARFRPGLAYLGRWRPNPASRMG